MRTTTNNRVRPGLVQFEQKQGWEGSNLTTETVWIFDGTQDLLAFPRTDNGDKTDAEGRRYFAPRGICDYGTIKAKGYEHVIVYRCSANDTRRLLELDKGWICAGRGSAYDYVTQMVPKGSLY
jgi:hypothetical protein